MLLLLLLLLLTHRHFAGADAAQRRPAGSLTSHHPDI